MAEFIPVNVYEADRGSLAAALFARRDEAIGEVVVAWDGYRLGDFVFVDECESGLVVSMPMTPQQISEQKSNGSLLREWLTIIGVPRTYVRVVL